MTYEHIFLAPLEQYLRCIFPLWQQHQDGTLDLKILSSNATPGPDELLAENETLALVFYDQAHRREILSVFAGAVPGQRVTLLTLFFNDEAYQPIGLHARLKWDAIQRALRDQGFLVDQYDHLLMTPLPPPNGASPDSWFGYRHECGKIGLKITLKEIAHRTGFKPDHIRKLHCRYVHEHGLVPLRTKIPH